MQLARVVPAVIGYARAFSWFEVLLQYVCEAQS